MLLPKNTESAVIPKVKPNDIVTSDHGYQCQRVEFSAEDGSQLTLKGGTYNTMAQCFDSVEGKDGRFTNNPWNYFESTDAYLDRKEKQMDKIIEGLKEGRLDYLLLQEFDTFYADIKNNDDPIWKKDHPAGWTEAQYKRAAQLKMKFLKNLTKMGYMAFPTTAGPEKTINIDGKDWNVAPKKDILTIVKTPKLSPVGKGYGLLGMIDIKKNVYAYKATAQDFNLTGKDGKKYRVCIINMHGDYGDDYKEAIKKIIQDNAKAGKLTIVAGDGNRIPGVGISDYIAAAQATSFYYQSTPKGQPKLDKDKHVIFIDTQYDIGADFSAKYRGVADSLKKNIDGFVYGAPEGMRASVYQEESVVFERRGGVGPLMAIRLPASERPIAVSEPGKSPKNPAEDSDTIRKTHALHFAKPKPAEAPKAPAPSPVLFVLPQEASKESKELAKTQDEKAVPKKSTLK